MRIWRKDRTQYAQLFFLNGKKNLGFLVGQQIDNRQYWEYLNGNRIMIQQAVKGEVPKEQKQFTIEETESSITKKYADGSTESTAKRRI